MSNALDVARLVQLVVYLGLAVAAIRTWRKQGSPASAWLAATFVVLGTVVLAASVLPDHSDRALVTMARKAVVAGLSLFPYFLYRFTAAFDRPRSAADRAAVGVTLAVLLATALVPWFPEAGDRRPGWWVPFVALLVVQWSALCAAVSVRLWRAGQDQPALARRRMRVMALASVVLNVAALLVASNSAGPHDGVTPAVQLLGLLSVALFCVGFAPPSALRILWRHPETKLLRQAEVGLMAAVDAAEVAHILLPRVTGIFGGKGAALVDDDGRVTASHGLSDDEAAAVATATDRTDVRSAPMRKGRLVVQSSPYSPFFGTEEDDLLRGLAMFADLALARAELFAQERAARRQVETANAELETFVYTVSHDLKTPLASLTGFVDLVRADLGDAVSADVAHSLDRMAAGTRYMGALINDLLELSRIGRVQTEAADVDLARVVEEIVDEQRPTRPGAHFTVSELPVVSMNPVRARQLFTNLLDNAVTHAGRPDVRVQVTCDVGPHGIRIVVADDGPGIPAEKRDRIFRVFEQLDRPDDRATGGTGIGLAVCRKIVEQIDGHIDVVDTAVGAAFEIRLPDHLLRARPAPVGANR